MKIIFYGLVVFLHCSCFMTIRVFWVGHVRMKLLRRDIHEYRRLWSFDRMMRRFWVWNVERMKFPRQEILSIEEEMKRLGE